MAKQRIIEVVADWVDLSGPTLMGRLTATPERGKEVIGFEYDEALGSRAEVCAGLSGRTRSNADGNGLHH